METAPDSEPDEPLPVLRLFVYPVVTEIQIKKEALGDDFLEGL